MKPFCWTLGIPLLGCVPAGGPPAEMTFLERGGGVRAVAFHPRDFLLASGGEDGVLRLRDPRRPEPTATLRLEEAITAVAFSPRGTLAAGTWAGGLYLWDVADGRLRHSWRGHRERISALAFSPDDRLLVSGSDDDTLRLWDPDTGEDLLTLSAGNDYDFTAVAFSPDGGRIASGDGEETIRLWEARTGEELFVLRGHEGTVTSAAFSPDGSLLVSGARDGTVRFWEAASGRAVRRLAAHADDVNAVAFRPDGKLLASAGDDGRVRLWDPASGRLLGILPHPGPVMSLAFSGDGSLLATGSREIVRLWTIPR